MTDPTPQQVQVTLDERPEGIIVFVAGLIDASTLTEVSAVLTEAQRDGRTLYVDLSGVTFIDSRGLGALLAANERAREGAAALRIHAPSDAVRRLLTISGVTAVIIEADELPAP
jgi:stage II sporulation protein AA (anti-sigma F factor antagonist)